MGVEAGPAGRLQTALEFSQQAEKLSLHPPRQGNDAAQDGIAVEAHFVTPRDPVVITADGSRLPSVPIHEAHKLNVLRDEVLGHNDREGQSVAAEKRRGREEVVPFPEDSEQEQSDEKRASRHGMTPPYHTHPLFPPLPLYGPPSFFRDVQCLAFRVSSFLLGAAFLAIILLGALFTSIGPFFQELKTRVTLGDPAAARPFYTHECHLQKIRQEQEHRWNRRSGRVGAAADGRGGEEEAVPRAEEGYLPTEGGPDLLVDDPAYYARRVGLDMETLQVETEDGFILELWHVFDPREQDPLPPSRRAARGPEILSDLAPLDDGEQLPTSTEKHPKKRFPVLLIHGLLQSSGAFCASDDASLAFYLAKSGFDVWLGNNRCGPRPRHSSLKMSDPRMWAWNIRHMGVFDLPALTARVLSETGFRRLALAAHSQGTAQTLVALAKEQRPDLGPRLTVVCALAPAAYAGPLVGGNVYFRVMKAMPTVAFRLVFGVHAFLPIMMAVHKRLNSKVYGWLGYKVFEFLFGWSDRRWDRGLRDRLFQFSPVWVSSESMRWWLGSECFARHKCILATREEEAEADARGSRQQHQKHRKGNVPKGSTAWYDERVPPFALWVCGNDKLVDGGRLLRRFEGGREPYVWLVHRKVIPEYEHLDVIWAVDAPEKVFVEMREVLWKTCDARDMCRVPKGCEDVEAWVPEKKGESNVDEESDGMQEASSDGESSA